MNRVGRPRAELPPPTHTLTARVRSLIDGVHAGKVRDASRLTGIAYPTLNDLYIGRSTNPNLATLDTLRMPYDIDLAWFLSDSEPEQAPRSGITAYLPPDASGGVKRRSLREVRIPFTAWSMCEVFSMLSRNLEAMDATAERPVVGEASGDAFLFRLSTFLFQPLLAAERAGERNVFDGAFGGETDDPVRSSRWQGTLTALGDMWLATIPGLLGSQDPDTT